jgi:topoisomerase-4 subunit B
MQFLNAGLTINFNGKKFFSKDGLLDLLKQKSDAEDLRYPDSFISKVMI